MCVLSYLFFVEVSCCHEGISPVWDEDVGIRDHTDVLKLCSGYTLTAEHWSVASYPWRGSEASALWSWRRLSCTSPARRYLIRSRQSTLQEVLDTNTHTFTNTVFPTRLKYTRMKWSTWALYIFTGILSVTDIKSSWTMSWWVVFIKHVVWALIASVQFIHLLKGTRRRERNAIIRPGPKHPLQYVWEALKRVVKVERDTQARAWRSRTSRLDGVDELLHDVEADHI